MSRLPFELVLALRYLRPKRTFVSVITLISVLGVSLGVAVLIIVLSVMSGFDQQSRERILGFSPHLRIVQRDQTMADYAQVMKTVALNPLVRAVAPYVQGPVLIETQPSSPTQSRRVQGAFLRGFLPELETNMSVLPHSIQDGKFDVQNRGLLVGSDLANYLSIQAGDRVDVWAPGAFEALADEARKHDGKLPADAQFPVAPDYDVRGIFEVGYYEFDSSYILTSLRDAQDLYDLNQSVHGLTVALTDPYKASAVKSDLARSLGPEFRITSWMEERAPLLGALVVEKNVMFYLLFFIMIVAALCILSALITFVVQKTREIGMLKALGAADLQVSLIFLSQGALVGIVGVLAGYGLGMLALAYRNEFLTLMDHLFGFQLFPPSIYNFDKLPALIIPRDILLVCGSALLTCTLGGAIPAWLAGRLKPVDALRYE